MAKRKSGALKSAKIPPPFPSELQPYNKPYSLGDVEYLKYLKDLASKRIPGGSKTTELAIDDLERETGGDFGKYIQMVTSRAAPSRAEQDFVEYLKKVGLMPQSMSSIYNTNYRGAFFPKASDKRKVYKSQTEEPQILVQDLDQYEIQGEKYNKSDIDSRSFADKLKAIFGYSRDDFSLAEERKKGTFPTNEEIEMIKRLQGMATTKGEELDHYAIHLLRNLGYETPEAIDRLGDKGEGGEEGYLGEINKLLYSKNKDELSKKDRNTLEELEKISGKELKKRRGYKEGGVVNMLKSFK